MDEPRTRILVEPDGRAVLLRTPLFRSFRFPCVDDAIAFQAGNLAAVTPLLIVGGLLALAKAIVPSEVFPAVLVVGLALGVVVVGVQSRRANRAQPPYEVLTWAESVALDDRLVRVGDAARDIGVGLAALALLGFVGFLLYDDPGNFLRAGLVKQAVIVLFVAGVGLGAFAGVYMGVQRLRFHRAQGHIRA